MTQHPLAPDLLEAARFLDLMAEGEDVAFQTFDDDDERKSDKLAGIWHGGLDEHAEKLKRRNASGAGIFWMVNAGDGQGRCAKNVTAVRAVFVDLDGAPLQPVLAAGAEPHAIIESSPGRWHVYWLVGDCELAQFKPVQRALAAKFNGDRKVIDLPRVMRLPGFIHRKAAPFRSRIESLQKFAPYSLADLMQRLALDLTQGQADDVDPETGEIRSRIAPGQAIPQGHRNSQLFRMGCGLRAHGYGEAAILAALQAENAERCQPPLPAMQVKAIAHSAARYERGTQPNLSGLLKGGASAAEEADPLQAMAAWIVTEEQVAKMEATRMLWREMLALSHVAAWVAPANGGKTTIAKQAAADLANDGYRVMFFQEDASAGDLPALFEHAKEHGYLLLNSTLSGSDPEQQVDVLQRLAKGGADLGNCVLMFDTLKKYNDLMSKRGSREFFKIMRALTQRGATVVLLGHTNKHRDPAGKLVFEGVGDVRNDVDELIYIESSEKDAQGIVTLTMTPDKVRAKVKPLSFRLDTHSMRLEPIEGVVDVAGMKRAAEQRRADHALIEMVTQCLRSGGKNRTQLVDEVHDLARSTGHSRREVERVIAEYCSTDPTSASALWIETRMRINNVRHIGLKPEAQP